MLNRVLRNAMKRKKKKRRKEGKKKKEETHDFAFGCYITGMSVEQFIGSAQIVSVGGI